MNPIHPPTEEDESRDTFFHGRILVRQKRKGYRFSVDAPLLADFIKTRESDSLIEIGTGCGIISLLLSIKPFRRITALEIQPDLADLARKNVARNGLEDRINVVQTDFRSYDPGRRFDAVFSNPPYIRGRMSRLSSSSEKSLAKHEILCDIFDIMRGTRAFLKENGRAYFIYPGKRRKDFTEAMNAHGLRLGVLRSVLSREGEEAVLFLAECDGASGETDIREPLILYGPDGKYTAEAEAIFAGRTDS